MSNTDSEKLRDLADWIDNNREQNPDDAQPVMEAADLRRIASDLEKREAPSDEEIEDAYRQYQIETIGFDVYEKGAFTSGAEWMRNKLTGK